MSSSRPQTGVSELDGEEDDDDPLIPIPESHLRRGITPKYEPGLEELIYSVPEKVVYKDYQSMEPGSSATRRLLIKVSEDSPKDKRRVQLFLPKIYPEYFEVKGKSNEEYIDLEMGGVLMLSIVFTPPTEPEEGCKNFQDWVQFKDCTTKLVLQVPLQAVHAGEEADDFQPMFPPLSVLPPKTAPMPPSRGGLQSQGSAGASQHPGLTGTVDPSTLLEAADALLLECDEPVPGFGVPKPVVQPPQQVPGGKQQARPQSGDGFEWSPDELHFYQAVVQKEEQRIKQDEFPEWDGPPEEKHFYKEWLEAEERKRQEETLKAQTESIDMGHAADSPATQDSAAEPRGFFIEQSIGLDGSPKVKQRSVLDVNPKEYGVDDEEVFLVDGVLLNARGEEVKSSTSRHVETSQPNHHIKQMEPLGGTVRDMYPLEEQDEESKLEESDEELMPWEVSKKKADKLLKKVNPPNVHRSNSGASPKQSVKSKEALRSKAQTEYQERLKKASSSKSAGMPTRLIQLGETVVTEKLKVKEGGMTAKAVQSKGAPKKSAALDAMEQQYDDAWDKLGS